MLYLVNGYFVDDKFGFNGYVVKTNLNVGEDDEEIFYYFNDRATFLDAVKNGTEVDGFVITSYEVAT